MYYDDLTIDNITVRVINDNLLTKPFSFKQNLRLARNKLRQTRKQLMTWFVRETF